MKKYGGLAVALVVLAALIAFAVVELRRDQREGKREVTDVIFPYGASRVVALDVTVDAEAASFRRGATGWERVSGPETADPGSVAEYVGAWSRLRFLEVVDENPRPEDLARFGLDKPKVRVSARIAPGPGGEVPEHQPSFEMGGKAPLNPAVYARVDGFPRVVLVTADALDLQLGVGRTIFGHPSEAPELERGKAGGVQPAGGGH